MIRLVAEDLSAALAEELTLGRGPDAWAAGPLVVSYPSGPPVALDAVTRWGARDPSGPGCVHVLGPRGGRP